MQIIKAGFRKECCRLLAAAVLVLPADAQDLPRRLNFSGFGTLGLAGTDTHAVGFHRDNGQSSLAAAIDKPTANIDTRLGLQFSYQVSDQLLATLQFLTTNRYDKVGYGILWVRPPVEVFGPLSSNRVKGLDLAQTFTLGQGAELELGAFAGRTDFKRPVTGVGDWDWEGGTTVGASAKLQAGPLRVRGILLLGDRAAP